MANDIIAVSILAAAICFVGATLLGDPNEPWGWLKAFGGMSALVGIAAGAVAFVMAIEWAITTLAS